MASVTKPVLLNETGEQIVEAINKVAEAIGGNGGGNSSGGGLPTGGESHQMLVTDEGGNAKWDERTHYSHVEMADIIPETTVEIVEGQGMLVDPLPARPTPGKTYTVTYNGVDYECVAGEMINLGLSLFLLGNMAAMGGDATDEPFLIMIMSEEAAAITGSTGGIMSLDGSESVTFKVAGEVETIKTLERKYLDIEWLKRGWALPAEQDPVLEQIDLCSALGLTRAEYDKNYNGTTSDPNLNAKYEGKSRILVRIATEDGVYLDCMLHGNDGSYNATVYNSLGLFSIHLSLYNGDSYNFRVRRIMSELASDGITSGSGFPISLFMRNETNKAVYRVYIAADGTVKAEIVN